MLISRNQKQRAGAALVFLRAAQRLAVDRDDAGNLRPKAPPTPSGRAPQNPAQRLRQRDAVAGMNECHGTVPCSIRSSTIIATTLSDAATRTTSFSK
jgi:hypothetical protein